MASSIAIPKDDGRWTTRGATHVPAGGGPTYWVAGDVYSIKSTAEISNGAFTFVDASVPPGGGPIAHIHTRSDEAFYVLDGELEMLDGDRIYTARTGDFVFVPRGIRHRFKNKGVHTVRLLLMFTPAGEERGFMLGEDARPGEPAPPWGPEDFASPELLEFFEEIGDVFLPEEGDERD